MNKIIKRMLANLSHLTCKLGFHWFMIGHEPDFTDCVSGKIVYLAKCPCNKHWLVDSTGPFPIFKVESTRCLGGIETNIGD